MFGGLLIALESLPAWISWLYTLHHWGTEWFKCHVY